MTVNPVAVVVALDQHPILMPMIGLKRLHGNAIDNPWLALRVDNDFLTGMRQNAPSFFFIQHSVVIWIVRDDITLIPRHDV